MLRFLCVSVTPWQTSLCLAARVEFHHGLLGIELRHRSLRAEVQKSIAIHYRGELVCRHRLDLVVEDVVVVEVKAVRKLRPIHQAQILSYLKASGYRVGLLMNFNVQLFVDGLRRFIR